jgi:hypothetical protein
MKCIQRTAILTWYMQTCFFSIVLIVLLVCKFLSPLSPPVSEPLTNRGVLLSTLLQDILHPSHHLLNVLLQTENKLGLSNKKKISDTTQAVKWNLGYATSKDKPWNETFHENSMMLKRYTQFRSNENTQIPYCSHLMVSLHANKYAFYRPSLMATCTVRFPWITSINLVGRERDTTITWALSGEQY